MKALCEAASFGMRVLSPRIEPPVLEEVGSTARTATRCFWLMSWRPSRSMSVDLPAPGMPVMPMRRELVFEEVSAARMWFAWFWCDGCADSARVMARARAVVFWDLMEEMSWSGEGGGVRGRGRTLGGGVVGGGCSERCGSRGGMWAIC